MFLRVFARRSAVTALAAAAVLAVAACSPASVAPLTAQQILTKSQQSSLKDTAFNLTFAAVTAGLNVTFTGNGKLTKNPSRSEFVLNASVLGQSLKIDEITDDATNSTYTQTTGIGATGTQWVKTSNTSASSANPGSSATNFGDIQNPTLVGKETLNGIATYHVKGTAKSSASAATSADTAIEEVWVRQDNFYPVKVVYTIVPATTTPTPTITSSGSDVTGTMTLTFTSWNTGLTIALPPPSEVTNG